MQAVCETQLERFILSFLRMRYEGMGVRKQDCYKIEPRKVILIFRRGPEQRLTPNTRRRRYRITIFGNVVPDYYLP